MVRIVLGPAKVVTWMALAIAACGGGSDAKTERPTERVPPTAVALNEADLDDYARGTAAGIAALRQAVRSGGPVDVRWVDSTAARAAGVSVERYRALTTAVEAMLKTQSVLAGRAARLDSLRIELLVLRVRAEAQP